ncbi:adhesion G protein-coupled receptor A3-like [Branchiostoma floridae]|uniref:Adhesion G protein-coupled receptor A3-like n=1 Tax=Branchiostoma floridae TaxID=7739 RepID=A0A9J7KWD8_BRAFL|nr:adhesion G protein-coupled receptor A3-like [Branchiostoma floridae]
MAAAGGLVLFLVLVWLPSLPGLPLCPSDICSCSTSFRTVNGSKQADGRKVDCSRRGLDGPARLNTTLIPRDMTFLNLQGNDIAVLKEGVFTEMPVSNLRNLDLSDNGISTIEAGAFTGLGTLEKLDLSNNQLSIINSSMFIGLDGLQRLFLQGNHIRTLVEDTFSSLRNIKMINLQSDWLICDCHLKWFLKWTKKNKIRLSESTVCAFPATVKNQRFKKLRRSQLTCDQRIELPVFRVTPSTMQLVIQGDPLPFQCEASNMGASMRIRWLRNGKEVVANRSAGIHIETAPAEGKTLIRSLLTVEKVKMNDSGVWQCVVAFPYANDTRNVSVMVISNEPVYCEEETIRNNKGSFTWPRVLAGVPISLPCPQGGGTGYAGGGRGPVATRRCTREGWWDELDVSQCQYVNEITRVLEMFTKQPVNTTNVLRLANQLNTYMREARSFRDKMDIIYTSNLMDKFVRFTESNRELGEVLVDIASHMMDVDEKTLWESQQVARACSRIVQCLERLASQTLTNKNKGISKLSANIAMEAFMVKPQSFIGMTCSAYTQDSSASPPYTEQHFICNSGNITNIQNREQNRVLQASIQIPPSVFNRVLSRRPKKQSDSFKLQFVVYKNGRLFPSTGNSTHLADQKGRRTVVTHVISSRIDGLDVKNLSEPVVIRLRPFAHGSDMVPVFWDFTELNGQGGWKRGGCQVVSSDVNLTTVHCNHLTNFAILQDMNNPNGKGYPHSYGPLEPLHPVVYAGSALCILGLLATLFTYIIFRRNIKIPRRNFHMLINLCLNVSLGCAAFTGGVNRIYNEKVCQGVGIVIHLMSLCTLLWIGIGARNVYKQMAKVEMLTPDLQVQVPRPMLRFYLVGWGVPMIICGITAAANLHHYGGDKFCWMEWDASLLAFFGPAALFCLVNCFLFIRTACAVQTAPTLYELKTMVESLTEQELSQAPSAAQSVPETESAAGTTASYLTTSYIDMEHSFKNQLRSIVFIMFNFVAMWACAAIAVSQDYFVDLIFSCFYGAASASLGLFVFIHYCVTREDVRQSWRMCHYREPKNNYHVTLEPTVTANGHIQGSKAHSLCSLESSQTNRTASSVPQQANRPKLTPLPLGNGPSVGNGSVGNGSFPDPSVHTHTHSHSHSHSIHSSQSHMSRPNGHIPRHPLHRPSTRHRNPYHEAMKLMVKRPYGHDMATTPENSSRPESRASQPEVRPKKEENSRKSNGDSDVRNSNAADSDANTQKSYESHTTEPAGPADIELDDVLEASPEEGLLGEGESDDRVELDFRPSGSSGTMKSTMSLRNETSV